MIPDRHPRPRRRRPGWSSTLWVLLVVGVALLNGCAETAEPLDASATTADPGPESTSPTITTPRPDVESTTTLEENRATEDDPPPPDSPPDLSVYSRNPNTPEGPIGTLCWARWEVGRYFVLYAVPDTDLARLLEEFRSSLQQASEALVSLEPPPELERFTAWLTDAVADVTDLVVSPGDQPAATFDTAGQILDFEYAPDVRTYADLAEAEPNCARP